MGEMDIIKFKLELIWWDNILYAIFLLIKQQNWGTIVIFLLHYSN